jgi:hypothetical protein
MVYFLPIFCLKPHDAEYDAREIPGPAEVRRIFGMTYMCGAERGGSSYIGIFRSGRDSRPWPENIFLNSSSIAPCTKPFDATVSRLFN